VFTSLRAKPRHAVLSVQPKQKRRAIVNFLNQSRCDDQGKSTTSNQDQDTTMSHDCIESRHCFETQYHSVCGVTL